MKIKKKKNINPDSNAITLENKVALLPSRKYITAGAFCLLLLALLLYSNTLTHDYVLDDVAVITKNKIVQQGVHGIPELVRTGFYYGYFGYNNNLYRPLPLITFAIGHSLWGNNPYPEHAINVLLYALSGILLFYTLLQLLGKHRWMLAWIIGAIFISHPIHTEVVANIKSRDEILALIFSLASLSFSLRYLRTNKILPLILAGLALFLGMLSKESAIAFVVIIPLCIYFFVIPQTESLKSGDKNKRNIIASSVALTAVVAYLSIRYALFHNDVQTTKEVLSLDNVMANQGFFDRLPTAVLVLGQYLRLLFVPHPLVYDYSFKEISLSSWGNILFLLSLLIYIVLLGYALYHFRKRSLISFGILFFLITIFVVSNISVTIGAGMAERFLFTPSIGFCIAVGILIFKFSGAPENNLRDQKIVQRVMPITFILILVYGFKTVTRNSDWKNQMTLFSHDVKNAPLSARAHYSLGNQLIEEGKIQQDPQRQKEMYDRAETELRKTLSIYSKYAEAIIALGNLYQEEGDYSKADEYLSQVSSNAIGDHGGNHEQLLYNKANALLGLKDYRGAIIYYSKALEANPKMTESYINMGIAYKQMNQFDSAIIMLNRAITVNPNSPEAYLNLGTCYSAKNDFTNAILNYNKALELKPGFAEAYIDLGDLYNRQGKSDLAESVLKKGYELNPRIPEAAFNLGYFYTQKNDFSSAITYLIRANELRPGYFEALINISYCASKLGRYQDVIDYAQKALLIRPDVPELYYNIAFGYNQLGDKAKAMEYKMKGDALKK